MINSNCLMCTRLPKRVILSIMGFLGIMVSFAIRSCLSIAITEMVVPVNSSGKGNESIMCPVDSTSIESVNIVKPSATRYNWTQEQQGWILSAFFFGYLVSHIPGALLAQKFGGKWTLSTTVLILVVCNAFTPIALEHGGEMALPLLLIIRILMGLGSGPSFPTVNVLLAAWIPQKESGSLGSPLVGGYVIGNFLSFYVSGLILSYWPWPVVFYFWSCIAAVWIIAFTLLCYSDPASHPFITKEELAYLQTEIGQLQRDSNLPQTPWVKILTSVPIMVLIFSQICNDWFYYVLASDLPKYMSDVLGFSVRDIGLYSSLPQLLMWFVSISSGFLCDFLIRRQYVTVLQARKLFTTLSGIFPATFLVAASYAGCDRLLVIVCFVLALGFFGNYSPGVKVNVLDLSPNYAGSIVAITNGSGALAGLAVPIFIGIMTPDSTLDQWRLVFWITFGILAARTVIFLTWASAEIQPWNDSRDHKSHVCDKHPNNIEKSIIKT